MNINVAAFTVSEIQVIPHKNTKRLIKHSKIRTALYLCISFYDSDESIQEEELPVRKLEAATECYSPVASRYPAQLEQNNIFCSNRSVAIQSLPGVRHK